MNIKIIENFNYNLSHFKNRVLDADLRFNEIASFHNSLNNKKTPLLSLPKLAGKLSIGKLFVKDESFRLGLNAFKILGASYAMYKQLTRYPQIRIFCTATDGNHGRAVAFMARRLKKNAIIFVPSGTVDARVDAIKKEGAKVIIVAGGYDAAVKLAYEKVLNENSKNNDHIFSLVQDTAWDGYTEIPKDIMMGYLTQVYELESQLKMEKIDIIFLQSGVGSWAGALVNYILQKWEDPPLFICVEPHSANCLFESIKLGKRTSVLNRDYTIMAGLNCESVSLLAWPILKSGVNYCLSISDQMVKDAMKILANPLDSDPKVISGESGASGLAGLIGLSKTKKYREFVKKIFQKNNPSVLVINTEGDTDPGNYKNIINEKKE